ncbi:PTS sugar transporter subunit IIA [Bacillus niameyensis]|uniref:PTS sugar transporter subunit IIA n=1 Tax=Bacillus niameyensis TaxID=1522308 RepID=UPI00078653E5|nr:hypothetical protein [Bacillus niameyensis]
MTSIVIAGHDQFPEGMGHTGEFISGAESGVYICSLTAEEDPKMYTEKLLSVINGIPDSVNVIILCDLLGGTPFKSAMLVKSQINKHVRIVSGINLPGLLTGIMLRDSMEIDELVEEIVKETKSGVNKF